MAWIESHEELADHKKIGFLAQLIGCSVPTAIGYVHLLWYYTLKVAWRDGNLADFIPPVIERACWWQGPLGDLITAFQGAGFLDGMQVHDWEEYAKHIIYQRKYNEQRRKNSTPFPHQTYSRNTAVTTAATQPNQTLPNQEKKIIKRKVFVKPTPEEVTAYAKTIHFELDGGRFVDHYESKGWMMGRTPMRNWQAAVRTWKRKFEEDNHGANDRPRGDSLAVVAERVRQLKRTQGLRKVTETSVGAVLDGVRTHAVHQTEVAEHSARESERNGNDEA